MAYCSAEDIFCIKTFTFILAVAERKSIMKQLKYFTKSVSL